jgi:hypothetical protein
MKIEEKKDFFSLLADVHDAYNVTCSPQAAELWFDVLRVQELPKIRAAIQAHMRNPQFGRFAPKPADVMREIEADSTPDYLVDVL